MAIADIIAADLAATAADAAAPESPAAAATWTTAAGEASAIHVIGWEATGQRRSGGDGETVGHTAACLVTAAEAGTIAVGDTVTVGGEDWSVETVRLAGAGAAYELELARSSAVERTRESYRIRR